MGFERVLHRCGRTIGHYVFLDVMFKRKADGTYKGRVVAQGWNQVPGVDCGSTLAPVGKQH